MLQSMQRKIQTPIMKTEGERLKSTRKPHGYATDFICQTLLLFSNVTIAYLQVHFYMMKHADPVIHNSVISTSRHTQVRFNQNLDVNYLHKRTMLQNQKHLSTHLLSPQNQPVQNHTYNVHIQ